MGKAADLELQPCGHALCEDCGTRMAEDHCTNPGGGGADGALFACPFCRCGVVSTSEAGGQ